MWHLRLLQEIELECDQKFHLSNGRVLIMAEASSLADFACGGKFGGNACATENIALNFALFLKISLIGCKSLYGSKQKYHCFLLKARGKVIFKTH